MNPMTHIIGKFSIMRKSNNLVIDGEICDEKDDQNFDSNIYFKDIPLVTMMVEAHDKGNTDFTAGVSEYQLLSLNYMHREEVDAEKPLQQVMLRHSETVHVVTASSFNGASTHCPNCDVDENTLLSFVTAHIQRKSNNKKYRVIGGVLHCDSCDYYYINKAVLRALPAAIRNDLGVQFTNIKLDEHGRIVIDDWKGAPDSILSRNGYAADGSLGTNARRDVIRYIIENNVGSHYDIQSHLTWLISTRSQRNPNAAAIWKNDLEWLQAQYGSRQDIKGRLA